MTIDSLAQTTPSRPTQPRRSQAERRAATRAALLDATIACLVDAGYARTTTRRIADRAGVSPGAQQHHFASKDVLVAEALLELADRLSVEIVEQGALRQGSDLDRAGELLDRLWEVHKGPLFQAAMELWVAARTDPELAEVLTLTGVSIALRVEQGTRFLFGDLAAKPGFVDAVVTGLATLRGLALQAFITGVGADDAWPATRAHLLAMFASFTEGSP